MRTYLASSILELLVKVSESGSLLLHDKSSQTRGLNTTVIYLPCQSAVLAVSGRQAHLRFTWHQQVDARLRWRPHVVARWFPLLPGSLGLAVLLEGSGGGLWFSFTSSCPWLLGFHVAWWLSSKHEHPK